MKYPQYHPRKKKWGPTVKKRIKMAVKMQKKSDRETRIYLPPGKYNEGINLYDGITLQGE